MSGVNFLKTLKDENPDLLYYAYNARNLQRFDFKSTNGISGNVRNDYYRGMPLSKNGEGKTIFASARDVGNIGAGYIAAANGLSWESSRHLFDAYQSISNLNFESEGPSTVSAELIGWQYGDSNTNVLKMMYNLHRLSQYTLPTIGPPFPNIIKIIGLMF